MSPTTRSVSLIALLVALSTGLLAPLANANNRNILFIAIDDMRVAPEAVTPTLDALAGQSTVYSNAYTPAIWCLPARTSVMFGLSPSTHQVGLANVLPDYDAPPYTDIYDNPQVLSLPEILSDAGYTTAVTGKVFHEPEPSKWDVNGPGIDWESFYDPYDATDDGTFMEDGPLAPGASHPDQAIADWAVQFIESTNGPFFLAVGFFQPHLPWIAPQWAYDLYPEADPHIPLAGDLNDEPGLAKEYAHEPLWWGQRQDDLVQLAGPGAAEAKTRAYYAAITHTDAMIGEVLAALDGSVHAATTDVIIWSDHGFHLGEKSHWRKRTYWQQTVRVPLIIKSPNLTVGTDATEVSLLDLAPTVLDLANVAPHAQFEGVSLRLGRSPVEIYHENGKATVTNDLKTIDYNVAMPGNFDRAQYDLAVDPDEITNLITPSGCGG